MGKLAANDLLTKFRHPISKFPQPGPPIFVDAKEKDLPYDGQCKHVTPSIFDHPLGLKQEGALLMAILTGLQGGSLEKATTTGAHERNLLHAKMGEDGETTLEPSLGPKGVKEIKTKKLAKADAMKQVFFGNALGTTKKRKGSRVSIIHQPRPIRPTCKAVTDAAINTGDLEELTGDESAQENAAWLAKSAEEEELYKRGMELEESIVDERTIPLDEYLKLVKKSTGKIEYRTQLLDELALGEDIDMWVKESDLPALPPPPPPEKSKETKEGEHEKPKSDDPAAKASPTYRGAMRATSLVVKKARHLPLLSNGEMENDGEDNIHGFVAHVICQAGLMHIEQQNSDLKDIFDWLQHLGSVSLCQPAKIDFTATSEPQGGMGGVVALGTPNEQKGDWRLPTSPALALLMAQDDLRERLAHLYEEKNLMESRKDQLDAAKKLVGKSLNDGEEEGYEVLGGKIAENLDDADKLDKHYRKWTEKTKEEEEMRTQKGKKGSKGKKGAVKTGTRVTDRDEDAPTEGRGKKSRKLQKKTGKDDYSKDEVLEETIDGDRTEEGFKTSKKRKTTKQLPTATVSSKGEGDSEVEEQEETGRMTRQGDDDTDSGGKKDKKRARVKATKPEDPMQLQEKDQARVEPQKSSHQTVQATKDVTTVRSGEVSGADSDTTPDRTTSKEKKSPPLHTAAPVSQSSMGQIPLQMSSPVTPSSSGQMQLSTGDGQSDFGGKTVGPIGGLIASEDVNLVAPDALSTQEDLARLYRQDARTQAKGIQTLLTQQQDFDHDIQEDFEIVNDAVTKSGVPSQDEAIQTDDAALFSLMESMMEEMPNDYQPSGVEDEASELKRLRREMKKARMQLRFWRSRNWVEKHAHLSHSGRPIHPILDLPSEAGFSFYFNAVRAPSVVKHPTTTHPTSTSGRDHAATPIRSRDPQVEALRPHQPMNVKLLSNSPLPAHTRLPRTSRRSSHELQSLTGGSGLVIFGRSSTLVTPHIDTHTVAHLPTPENRISRLSPRLSGMQHQKA